MSQKAAKPVPGKVWKKVARWQAFEIVKCRSLYTQAPLLGKQIGKPEAIFSDRPRFDDRIAHFQGDCRKPDEDYVFWVYSRGVYKHVLKMLGFDIVKIGEFTFKANWSGQDELRYVITATREPDH